MVEMASMAYEQGIWSETKVLRANLIIL